MSLENNNHNNHNNNSTVSNTNSDGTPSVVKNKVSNSGIILSSTKKTKVSSINNKKQIQKFSKKIKSNKVSVSQKNADDFDCNECIDNMAHPIRKKPPLEKRFNIKVPLQKIFNAVLFKMVNPTNIPCSFNLFDGFSLTPVPNTPNGYVPQLSSLGIPIMNFPPSTGSTYPSSECATVDVSSIPIVPYIGSDSPLATTYVPTTDRIYTIPFSGLAGCVCVVINPNTNLVVNQFFIGLGGNSWMSTFASVSNKVYVIDKTTSIVPIDCATETPLPPITLPAAASQISYSATNNYLYVTVPSLDRLYYIDCATDIIVGFISLVGGGSNVTALTTWTNGVNSYALVLNPTNTTAFYINTILNTVISTFAVTNPCDGFGAICYNSVKNTVYYLDSVGNILEINMTTQTMLGTSISGGFGGLNTYSLLFIPTYNIIYADTFTSPIINANIINCVTNTIDLILPTSVSSVLVGVIFGVRFAYDSANNTVWVGGDANDVIVSKLCRSNGMCYIVGSTDYNEFIQDLRNNPICVRQMQFYTQSSAQTSVPLEIQTKDANGNLCVVPRLPNITISTDQFQPNISTVDFECKDMILDCLTTIHQYEIAPNSEVTFVMYYKQISKVDILTSKKTVCKTLDKSTSCSDGNSRTEEQVKFNSPRPHIRPNWLRPFNKSMVKDKNQLVDDCNTCFEELGRPAFTANVNPVVIDIPKEVFTLKFKLDSSNDCNECIDNIGHPIVKKLDKFYEKSVKDFDIIYNKVKLDSFSDKCCLKDL